MRETIVSVLLRVRGAHVRVAYSCCPRVGALRPVLLRLDSNASCAWRASNESNRSVCASTLKPIRSVALLSLRLPPSRLHPPADRSPSTHEVRHVQRRLLYAPFDGRFCCAAVPVQRQRRCCGACLIDCCSGVARLRLEAAPNTVSLYAWQYRALRSDNRGGVVAPVARSGCRRKRCDGVSLTRD